MDQIERPIIDSPASTWKKASQAPGKPRTGKRAIQNAIAMIILLFDMPILYNRILLNFTFFDIVLITNAHIAQLVEHTTDTREVPGSIPGVRTKMEESKYQGRLVEVIEKKIERNGATFTAEIVRRPPGTRLIIIKDGMVLLTKEFRHELNRYDYRLPGGKVYDTMNEYREAVNAGLNIKDIAKKAAAKEALEEAGIEPKNIKHVHTSICGAAVCWDLLYFLVSDFNQKSQNLEVGEDISIEWVSTEEARARCLDGRISEERSALVLLRHLEGKI